MDHPTVRGSLPENLERDDFTIEELIEAADKSLAVLAPRQTRYKVTERPDVRTIRYYTSQRLLPSPVSYEGGRARYSGSHLIRLLLIKRLQTEHYTLAKIAAVLREASDDEVLSALDPERAPATVEVEALSPPALRVENTRRVHLVHGATLHIPEDLLQDSTRRQGLVEALASLARTLTQSKGA